MKKSNCAKVRRLHVLVVVVAWDRVRCRGGVVKDEFGNLKEQNLGGTSST